MVSYAGVYQLKVVATYGSVINETFVFTVTLRCMVTSITATTMTAD